MLLKNPCLSSASVKMKCGIVPRATTAYAPCTGASPSARGESASGTGELGESPFYDDSTVASLLPLGNLLASCDASDLEILSFLAKGLSYEEIAERLYMSENGVKYRTKRFIKLCGESGAEGISGKKEFSRFLSKYM